MTHAPRSNTPPLYALYTLRSTLYTLRAIHSSAASRTTTPWAALTAVCCSSSYGTCKMRAWTSVDVRWKTRRSGYCGVVTWRLPLARPTGMCYVLNVVKSYSVLGGGWLGPVCISACTPCMHAIFACARPDPPPSTPPNTDDPSPSRFDCGVFTVMNADFISDDLPLSHYSQRHASLFRRKMTAAILRGSLDYPLG